MNLTKNQSIILIVLYIFVFIVGIVIGKYTEKVYGIERILLETRSERFEPVRMMRY